MSTLPVCSSAPGLGAVLLAMCVGGAWAQSTTPSASAALVKPVCAPLLNKTFPRLQDEKPQSLCQYSGKVILVVNTASYCGFTSQYKGLEALYAKYKDRGLVVLGFPSNDFGQQEPDSGQQIAEFCANTFGVKFPMFAKSSVKGSQANPLFVDLAKLSGTTPKWNFYKYLINRDGRKVEAYNSLTAPDSRGLVADIEAALSATP